MRLKEIFEDIIPHSHNAFVCSEDGFGDQLNQNWKHATRRMNAPGRVEVQML